MPKDLFSRYVWIVDTIRRHGAITRHQLNEKWKKSQFSDGGQPLTRRTFYNYRNAIAELFQVNIECNPVTYEYNGEGRAKVEYGRCAGCNYRGIFSHPSGVGGRRYAKGYHRYARGIWMDIRRNRRGIWKNGWR